MKNWFNYKKKIAIKLNNQPERTDFISLINEQIVEPEIQIKEENTQNLEIKNTTNKDIIHDTKNLAQSDRNLNSNTHPNFNMNHFPDNTYFNLMKHQQMQMFSSYYHAICMNNYWNKWNLFSKYMSHQQFPTNIKKEENKN